MSADSSIMEGGRPVMVLRKPQFADVVPTPFGVDGVERKRDNEDLRIYVLKKMYQKRVIQGTKPKSLTPEEIQARKQRDNKPKKLRKASVNSVNTRDVLLVQRRSKSASTNRNNRNGELVFEQSPSNSSCGENNTLVNNVDEELKGDFGDAEFVEHLDRVESKYGTLSPPISPPVVREIQEIIETSEPPVLGEPAETEGDLDSVSTDVTSSTSSIGVSLEDIPNSLLNSSESFSSSDQLHRQVFLPTYGQRRKRQDAVVASTSEIPSEIIQDSSNKSKRGFVARKAMLIGRCFACSCHA
jgi:hypothetical protein